MSTICPNCRSLQPTDDGTKCIYCDIELRSPLAAELVIAGEAPDLSREERVLLPSPLAEGEVAVSLPPSPTPVREKPPLTVSLSFPRKIPGILKWSDPKVARTALLTGLGLGVFFSVAAFRLSPKGSILALMFDLHSLSGLIPVSIAVMFFWGAIFCFLRWRRLQAVRLLSGRKLLEEATRQLGSPGPEALRRVEALATHLERDGYNRSPLLRRLHAVLRQWRLRPGVNEADLVLAQHRAQDEEGVRRGFQLIRAFVWAMPVVGLMGTVIGISLAVGGFAKFLAGGVDDVSAIKQSLVGVTEGLSFAFLITLEGLLGALLLMLPSTALQAREEELLVSLEHGVAETFLPELQRVAPVAENVAPAVRNEPSAAPPIEEILHRVLSGLPALQRWQEEMARLTDESIAAVTRAAEQAGENVLQAIGRANDDIATALRTVVQLQEKLADRMGVDAQRSHAETQRLLDSATQLFGAAAGEVTERFERLHRAEVATLEELARNLEVRSRELASGLAAHQEGFRDSVERWRTEGPRVDSYFAALRELGRELDRAMQVQRELQRQVTDLNANGTLTQALDHVDQTMASLQPFLKRLTGTFHFVAAAEEPSSRSALVDGNGN